MTEYTNLTCELVDDPSEADVLAQSAHELQVLHSAKRELVDERKRLNRSIGQKKKQGLDPTPEKHRSRELGQQMKAIDADIENMLDTMQDVRHKFGNTFPVKTNLVPDKSVDAVSAKLRSRVECDDSVTLTDTIRRASVAPETNTAPMEQHADLPPERFRPLDPGSASVGPITIDDDPPDEAWDRYVDRHPHATIYHSSRAIRLLGRGLAHSIIRLAARDANGEITGVLPLVHLNSRLFGNFIVSLPVFNYGGPLANHASVGQQLIDEVGRRGRILGCSHAEIRECHERHAMPSHNHKVAMIRHLPNHPDLLDRSLGASVRNQISKAERLGATLQVGGEELLDAFYAVFTENMRDLGTPVHSRAFFADVLATFSPAACIAVVTTAGKPAAAAFLIGYRDTLEVPWASALRRFRRDNVNMYLYRGLLGHAIAGGYRYFDFGRSTEGSNTWRFKKQWGARPYPLHWHYWLDNDAELPSLSPDNPRYRIAIDVWQRLPVWLSRLIGPPIVRHLP